MKLPAPFYAFWLILMQEKLFLKKIGKQIAHYRKEQGMTQMELSDLAEIEQSALARIEAGNTNITALTMLKIAKALGLSPKKIMDFD